VIANEQKGVAAEGKPTLAPQAELRGVAAGEAPALRGLELKELEGHWCSESCDLEGHAKKRILEIKDGALELSTLDPDGHVCASARGNLKWIGLPDARVLAISECGAEAECTSPVI